MKTLYFKSSIPWEGCVLEPKALALSKRENCLEKVTPQERNAFRVLYLIGRNPFRRSRLQGEIALTCCIWRTETFENALSDQQNPFKRLYLGGKSLPKGLYGKRLYSKNPIFFDHAQERARMGWIPGLCTSTHDQQRDFVEDRQAQERAKLNSLFLLAAVVSSAARVACLQILQLYTGQDYNSYNSYNSTQAKITTLLGTQFPFPS